MRLTEMLPLATMTLLIACGAKADATVTNPVPSAAAPLPDNADQAAKELNLSPPSIRHRSTKYNGHNSLMIDPFFNKNIYRSYWDEFHFDIPKGSCLIFPRDNSDRVDIVSPGSVISQIPDSNHSYQTVSTSEAARIIATTPLTITDSSACLEPGQTITFPVVNNSQEPTLPELQDTPLPKTTQSP